MIALVQRVLEHSTATRPTDRLVHIVLAHFANDRGLAWPSIEQIAECAGASKDDVRSALFRLERASLIARGLGGGQEAPPDVIVWRVEWLGPRGPLS